MIKNNIFLDLDDTLAFSFYCGNEKTLNYYKELIHEDHKFVEFTCGGEGWSEGNRYLTVIRPLTFELLNYCENLVGHENLYILTLATKDYACHINRLAGFGISNDRIFSREDLHINAKSFKDQNNILIDNEYYEYHCEGERNKVNFLHGLSKEKYVNIQAFDPHGKWELDDHDTYLDNLKNTIKTALHYGKEI